METTQLRKIHSDQCKPIVKALAYGTMFLAILFILEGAIFSFTTLRLETIAQILIFQTLPIFTLFYLHFKVVKGLEEGEIYELGETSDNLEYGNKKLLMDLAQSDAHAIIETLKKEQKELTEKLHLLEQSSEEAIKFNQLKSQFLANMSHELRTPMHSILSFSKICLKKVGVMENLKLINHLETIHTSGSRLLHILDEVLDISRLEAGMMKFAVNKTDFMSTLNDIHKELQSLILDKGIKFEIKNNAKDTMVELDYNRICQVIQNVISNAIKFGPQDSDVEIEISNTNLAGSRALKFRISDQGPGIPEDELETVFDKFIQSSKTAQGHKGSGLGLCIAREIIKAHSGKIYAEKKEVGASFVFILPLKQECSEFEHIIAA